MTKLAQHSFPRGPAVKYEAVAKDSPFRTGTLKTETDVMELVFERSTGTTTNAGILLWITRRHGNMSRHIMVNKPGRYPPTPPAKRRHDSRNGSL